MAANGAEAAGARLGPWTTAGAGPESPQRRDGETDTTHDGLAKACPLPVAGQIRTYEETRCLCQTHVRIYSPVSSRTAAPYLCCPTRRRHRRRRHHHHHPATALATTPTAPLPASVQQFLASHPRLCRSRKHRCADDSLDWLRPFVKLPLSSGTSATPPTGWRPSNTRHSLTGPSQSIPPYPPIIHSWSWVSLSLHP